MLLPSHHQWGVGEGGADKQMLPLAYPVSSLDRWDAEAKSDIRTVTGCDWQAKKSFLVGQRSQNTKQRVAYDRGGSAVALRNELAKREQKQTQVLPR